MSRCTHQMVRHSLIVVLVQCALSVIAVQGACVSIARRVGCSSFSCGRALCDRVLCKELRSVPSWSGASMVFTSRRRVAFKSNSVVRGTTSPVGFCCKCSARVSAVCFQITFPVLLVQNILVMLYNTRHGDWCHRA